MMTFDQKVTVFAALKMRRSELLTRWFDAHADGRDTAYLAEQIMDLNDAEPALRKAMPY